MDDHLSVQEIILEHFDEEQGAHIMVLLGRIVALERLVEALWTHILSDFSDPMSEAEMLRDNFMSLVNHDVSDPIQGEAIRALEERFSTIVERVENL